MECVIDRSTGIDVKAGVGLRITAGLDRRSLIGTAIGAVIYCSLAMLSLWLTRAESSLAAVWLPNAAAVAFLLRARMPNELPFMIGVIGAATVANMQFETPAGMAIAFAIANVAGVVLVAALTRRVSGPHPDMTDITDLAWFVWIGGVIGPLASTSLAAIALVPAQGTVLDNALDWLFAESLSMILIAPAALLAYDAWAKRNEASLEDAGERAVLMTFGLLTAVLVFGQSSLPLLFLIPPITLLHAFRLGSLGSAIFVGLLAGIASIMTSLGQGPLALVNESDVLRSHVLQAFVAANFLTGLPVAAVLAGRRRAMEEVELNRRQFDLLAANITDAILRYDLNGICTFASSSVRDVLGAEPEEFVGQRASDRMHDEARARILLAEERLLSGESEKERFTYRRFTDAEDGSPVFIEAECALAKNPETGTRDGIVVSARDVTERVELELLLTRARSHAENAARAKSEFLANMSHEIRTPMNGVLGFAELMQQTELDDGQRRYTTMIVESGRSMMLLLNDILDLSKIEAGQISIDRSPVDLRSTILDCIALHRPTAEKSGLALRFEFESHSAGANGEHDPWVLTDGLRLRQILLNLIGNAVKFTEQGQVRVRCEVADAVLTLAVIDTGIGISESRLESIFTPFTQAENDTARRFGGTGLGLSISRHLAELLGGRIEVDSEPGKGSTFTLTLPAREVPPEHTVRREADTVSLHDIGCHEGKPARILLAEDHEINRALAVEMLEHCGQEVAIAHDGNEAISMVIDSIMRSKPFDLVLMDIQMPGCDGYAATRAIRAEGIDPLALPIVALTANAFPEDIAAARDAGMQAHLVKPLAFAELVRALQRWLPTRIIDEDERERHAPPPFVPTTHSRGMIERWLGRRRETIEAVQHALDTGALAAASPAQNDDVTDDLIDGLHKLAGTAAMFGEDELGGHAAALERALRKHQSREMVRALANELLHCARTKSVEHPAFDEADV